MENRFLGLIEKSIKSHWNQPAFSDYKGETFLYRDLAIQIAQLHILFNQAGINLSSMISNRTIFIISSTIRRRKRSL